MQKVSQLLYQQFSDTFLLANGKSETDDQSNKNIKGTYPCVCLYMNLVLPFPKFQSLPGKPTRILSFQHCSAIHYPRYEVKKSQNIKINNESRKLLYITD